MSARTVDSPICLLTPSNLLTTACSSWNIEKFLNRNEADTAIFIT